MSYAERVNKSEAARFPLGQLDSETIAWLDAVMAGKPVTVDADVEPEDIERLLTIVETSIAEDESREPSN
jgi:hypothetical protein